jgi:hypothetical protein
MAVEDPTSEHRVEVARGLPDLLEEVRGEPLGAEFHDEPVVVNLALHVPRRDDEIFGQSDRKRGRLDKGIPSHEFFGSITP